MEAEAVVPQPQWRRARSRQGAGRVRKDPPPEPLEGIHSGHLHFGLLVSRIVREEAFVISKSVMLGHGSPRTLTWGASRAATTEEGSTPDGPPDRDSPRNLPSKFKVRNLEASHHASLLIKKSGRPCSIRYCASEEPVYLWS